MKSESNENIVKTSVQEEQNTKPGQLLCRLRERSLLSYEDVSKHLKLSVDKIKDIEADHYKNLGGFVFVRGYLRAYAKLLDYSGDEIVGSFDKLDLHENKTEYAKIPIMQEKIGLQSRKPWLRWVTYLIGAILIVSIGLWWRSEHTAYQISHLNSKFKADHIVQQLDLMDKNKYTTAFNPEKFTGELFASNKMNTDFKRINFEKDHSSRTRYERYSARVNK